MKRNNYIAEIKISALDHTIMVVNSNTVVEDEPVKIDLCNDTAEVLIIQHVDDKPDRDETAWVNLNTGMGFEIKFKFVKRQWI